MKFKKRILTFVLLISLIINRYPIMSVNASTNQSDFEVGSVNDIAGFPHQHIEYVGSGELPETLSFFYVHQGFVHAVPINSSIVEIINRRLGTSFDNTWFTSFMGWFTAGASVLSWPLATYWTGYSNYVFNNGTLCGFALTQDIVGKPYGLNNGTDEQLTIPSSYVTGIYNAVNYYIETESPIVPDYINIGIQSNSYALEHLDNSNNSNYYQNYVDCFTNNTGYLIMNVNSSGNIVCGTQSAYYAERNEVGISTNFVSYNESSFNTFCNAYNLNVDHRVVTFNDFMGNAVSGLSIYAYSKESGTSISFTHYTGGTSTSINSADVYKQYVRAIPFTRNGGYMTIFKNATIMTNMRNKTYTGQPITLGNDFYNFNEQGDNSINTTNTTINNAPSTNNQIYQQQSEVNTNYYYEVTTNTDNSQTYIDNSTVINNNQTIINNYYSDNGGGGDDNGGDDDNNSIWDKLLEALGALFDKLGDIITVVATGIISIFTTILNLIVEISTNFTTITDTLSAFFSWIPTEIMTPIILGVNLMILIILLNAIKR